MLAKRNILFVIALILTKLSLANRAEPRTYSAELNSTKTHYFVSMTGLNETHKGYTAVFDAVTHKLKFKIENDFANSMIFLSPDGNRLVVSQLKPYDNTTLQILATIYDSTGLKSSMLFPPSENSAMSGLLDISDDQKNINYYFQDSILSISIKDWTATTFANNDNPESEVLFFYEQTYIGESLFNLDTLKCGEDIFKDRLLRDINLTESTYPEARQYISISLAIDTNGTLIKSKVYGIPHMQQKDYKGTNTFPWTNSGIQQKITDLINGYTFDKSMVPEGVDFWVYTGSFYL